MATYCNFYERSSQWDFSVLNQGKQKGYNSFRWSDKSSVYVSAEASGFNKRQFFSMRSTSCLILLSLSELSLKSNKLKYSDIFIKFE